MPLLHDGFVFTFTHGSSKYNHRQNKIEEEEEAEEKKEFALFRQEVLQQKRVVEHAEPAVKKQRKERVIYEAKTKQNLDE